MDRKQILSKRVGILSELAVNERTNYAGGGAWECEDWAIHAGIEHHKRRRELDENLRECNTLLGLEPNSRERVCWQASLIHGVFNKQDHVLAAFKEWCAAKNIDFGRFSWGGPEAAPDFDPNDHETVVVLDATLDTLQNTFEFAWEWTVDGQEYSSRGEAFMQKKLRLLSDERPDDAEGDSPDFKPWTLSWQRIKLDTNIDKKPSDVRNSNSPGCALLFMTAEHPERIKATDYQTCFPFWLPGLKWTDSTLPGLKWADVPCVSFNHGCRAVSLSSGRCDSTWNHDRAVPVLLE